MTPERAEGRERDKDLLSETIDSIEKFRPEMVISENVGTIGSGKYKPLWDDFQLRLSGLGYTIGTKRVCASRFGVPQNRRRSILMGIHRGQSPDLYFDLPVPDHDQEAPPVVSVQEAVGHLPI